MHPGAALASTLVLLVAGCVGEVEGTEKPPSVAPTAEKSEDTGGIQGSVVTDEIQPIAGAQVGIAKTSDAVKTAEDGGFAFSKLPPGDYTLIAARLGYFEAYQKVLVQAGEITKVQIILQRIPVSEGPFNETMKFRGSLLLNTLCAEDEPQTKGLSWQEYTIPVNATKPDGTELAAIYMAIEFRSEPNAATIDVDIHLFDPSGKEIASGTQFAPKEDIVIEKLLPPGNYRLYVCLYMGTQADYRITTTITYEQGEAAAFAKKGKK